ncbi:MAG: hypothetical protein WCC60_20285 [Ilumatobacteraceae bacterium]
MASADALGLHLTVGSEAPCVVDGIVPVTVTNSTDTTCTSDIMATLSDGQRLIFSSRTGYGGERGSWAPLPTDVVEGVGVIEYPPGTRTWPITFPAMDNGIHEFTLPIWCADANEVFVASFSVNDR